jgi:hypothetical protein
VYVRPSATGYPVALHIQGLLRVKTEWPKKTALKIMSARASNNSLNS